MVVYARRPGGAAAAAAAAARTVTRDYTRIAGTVLLLPAAAVARAQQSGPTVRFDGVTGERASPRDSLIS